MDLANFLIFAVSIAICRLTPVPLKDGKQSAQADWWATEVPGVTESVNIPQEHGVQKRHAVCWLMWESKVCIKTPLNSSKTMTVPLRLMHPSRWVVVTPRVLARPQGFAEVQAELGAKVLYRSVLQMSAQGEHLETAERSGVTGLTLALFLVVFWPRKPCRCCLKDTINFQPQVLCIFSSVQTASFVEGLFLWKGWFLHLHGLEAWFMNDSSHYLGSVQPVQTCTCPTHLKHMWYVSWLLVSVGI